MADLNELQTETRAQAVLAFLMKQTGGVTTEQVAAGLNITLPEARVALNKLEDRHRVRRSQNFDSLSPTWVATEAP